MGKYINKSTLFLPSMFNYTQDSLGNDFIGCFISVEDEIIFLFDKDSFRDSRITRKDFIGDNIGYFFNVPEIYKKDFDIFKKSKYSHFSTDFKLKVIELEGIDSLAAKVISKSPDRRKYVEEVIGMDLPTTAEVLSALNMDEEIIM